MIKLKCSWEQPADWKDSATITLLQDFKLAGVSVPKGFKSDGVTAPRILWNIVAPMGKALPAALVHDYLLSLYQTRDYADLKFKEALLASGISKTRAQMLYLAVRLYSKYKELTTYAKSR